LALNKSMILQILIASRKKRDILVVPRWRSRGERRSSQCIGPSDNGNAFQSLEKKTCLLWSCYQMLRTWTYLAKSQLPACGGFCEAVLGSLSTVKDLFPLHVGVELLTVISSICPLWKLFLSMSKLPSLGHPTSELINTYSRPPVSNCRQHKDSC
jgi:hypothetical protein